ncbi:cytochrome P450 [Annulohypoxylon truncatum]|uniref:cytochrome P450 n=1 Tax=Annulohypoxylon truncatum TaxID=327061 RepID=UPI0020073033|nr:cytochrome P450 [Annulohypoxylon truncatum]KAI1207930.1 cytochrome P450 [Annulohypoxylon truncatum]
MDFFSINSSQSALATIGGVCVGFLILFTVVQKSEFRHIPKINGIYSHLRRRVEAWMYLFDGTHIIERNFNKANGNPFEVFSPENRYVFVSSRKHIKELDSAPDTVLSLQAASKEMLQPKYTMHGFNWFDRRGTEGIGFVRALRTLLTNNVPQIVPELSVVVQQQFLELGLAHGEKNGSFKIPIYPSIVQLVVLSNALSFFGKEHANNKYFMESALMYIEETIMCAEIVKLLPGFLSPLIGGLIARRLKSHEVIFQTLLETAEERCRERDQKHLGQTVPQHADCIQWIMETSPRERPWTPERIVHELMAIWFGSVHAMATTITFAVHDLCLHPSYKEPLLQECVADYEKFQGSGMGLPLLDSFIKESARLTPVESMSTRRAALQRFTLSDGTTISPGEWACTPVRAIMQSAEHYPEPTTFYGFRFANQTAVGESDTTGDLNFRQPSPSKLTDVDHAWHVWGTGRMACPGRYYATAVMKVIMAQIILNYDCELEDAQQPRWFSWRSTVLPRKNTMVRFTSRCI